MRSHRIIVIQFVILLGVCLSYGISVDAGPEPKDNPEPAQKMAAEIEQLGGNGDSVDHSSPAAPSNSGF